MFFFLSQENIFFLPHLSLLCNGFLLLSEIEKTFFFIIVDGGVEHLYDISMLHFLLFFQVKEILDFPASLLQFGLVLDNFVLSFLKIVGDLFDVFVLFSHFLLHLPHL